jgi:DNA topoisomerase I
MDNNISEEIIQSLRKNKLVYVTSEKKGFTRKEKNGQFIYLDTAGKEIKSEEVLHRIKALVIPPAWTDVWICPKENGHIQVTGLDAKGRKQYRYHTDWQKFRNETKFDKLYQFGKKLNNLRKQIQKDLRRKNIDKQKVTALALSVMENTFIRVGNAAYEKENGSYGLTTLKNRHIRFDHGIAIFKFVGKKGVKRMVQMRHRSLINLLKKVKDLPGQEIFQYYDADNNLHSLNSSDINHYLKEHMKEDFTCKDFRTWGGCVCALQHLLEDAGEQSSPKSLPALIDKVAERLGNTRTVCKKYYIHPQLLLRYENGEMSQLFPSGKVKTDDFNAVEKAFLNFLKKIAA